MSACARLLCMFGLLAGLLAACAGPANPGSALPGDPLAARRETSFTEEDCPGEGNPMFAERVRCGTLTVPLRHNDPGGEEIQLRVVIYKATGDEAKPDPVVFLWFGPGPELQYSMAFPYIFDKLGADRDLITIDHRGVGASEPALHCGELSTTYYDTIDLPPTDKDTLTRWDAVRQGCWDQWQSDGVDFDAFSTAEVVEDLEDLRVGLGVRQWNVVGTGYGARVALELAGKYPSGVRALAVDAIEPTGAEQYRAYADRGDAILERFFELCAEDKGCNETYPTLKDTFYKAVEQRDASPALLEVQDLSTGSRNTVYVNGARFIDITLAVIQLNFLEFFPELPRMIEQVADNNYDVLKRVYGQILSFHEPNPTLSYWRYWCVEALPLSTRDEVLRLDAAESPVAAHMRPQAAAYFDSCAPWEGTPEGAAQAPYAFQPPGGNMPLLALHGTFYGTAREWTETATTNMENRQIIDVLDGLPLGYLGAPGTSCAADLIEAFVIDPTAELDLTCATTPRKYTWITMK